MEDPTEIIAANCPRLELRAGGRAWQAIAGRTLTIGRANEADVRLENPRVSRDHAVLQSTPAGWVLVNHSNNGTYVNGQRVESLTIRQPVTVILGSLTSGEALQLSPAAPAAAVTQRNNRTNLAPTIQHSAQTAVARSPAAVHTIEQVVVTIGRAPSNTVVLDDLLVSRHHAVLRHVGNQWHLADNGSANGTYVNGNRINSVTIGPHDIVGIGHQLLHLADDRLVEYVDTGDVSYEAHNLRVVTEKGKVLLADVSFALPERSFMAVVGPSGAGKSTLLGALTGFRPASAGEIRYDHRDLYTNYAELRHRIGFVPQDDILHTPLTVRRALNYAARLRFPQDVSASERKRRIGEVLGELGLAAHADQRIDSLSGGQRKRTSVALELLTKPSLLFLDEPTSGLDPGYEKSVMQTLRALANDGRSVVVVTHNTAQLNLCDWLLILAPGGRLAYFGPPRQALSYFNCGDFADLFTLLERDQTTDWTGRFNASALRQALSGPRPAYRPPHFGAMSPKAAAQQSPFSQFVTLCQRYLAVIAADRPYAVALLLLPLGLSLLAHFVPGKAGLSVSTALEKSSVQPSQLLVLLIISGALMGCAVSYREIVKERAIYRRENGIGLSRTAYLASKLVVLTAITTVQGLILGLLGVAFLPGPDQSLVLPSPRLEVAVAVIAVTVVSMMIGLLISAIIGNADRGVLLLVLVVITELVLSGGIFGVKDRMPAEQLAWFSPSRWAYGMGGSTVALNGIKRPADQDPLWDFDLATWLLSAAACWLQALVLIALLVLRLKRLDPQRKLVK